MLSISTRYTHDKKEVDNGRSVLPIGGGEGEFLPYDMLFGALSSCLFYTFNDVVNKQRLFVEEVEMVVTGEKREEVPTTLSWVNIEIRVKSDADPEKIQKAADLACKYCSIHETIKQVADVKHEVKMI